MAAPVAAALASKATRRRVLQMAGVAGLGIVGTLFAGGAALAQLSAALPDSADDDLKLGPPSGEDGPVNPNGWAWPSHRRGISQPFHQGMAIDLVTDDGGPLYSPYAGVIVRAGVDGGIIPPPCVANPSWWRGDNNCVVIAHQYQGRTMYSSHNHIRPGSPGEVGIRPGVSVRAGQRVAVSGMSGCTSGPHTHFTLSTEPTPFNANINPFPYIGNP